MSQSSPSPSATDLPVASDPPPAGGGWRRLIFAVPLLAFLAMAVYFWIGLGRDPHVVPSVLIDQPVPPLALAAIPGRDAGLTTEDLRGRVSLLNVFGSWCVACLQEHPLLMQLKAQGVVPIHGIDWREPTPDAGTRWLARHGDPYTLIGADPESKAAIALGVTGAPETFVVDAQGVIRYKHIGPITPTVWEETLWPIVRSLEGQ